MPESILNSFEGKRLLVVGDIVADQYLNGNISRVSREAPVFILKHEDTITVPGGAANAAANVASLGAIPVLIGLAGNDLNGPLLLNSLKNADVSTDNIIIDDSVTTTAKVRVLAAQNYAARQQVIRIDYESDNAVSDELKSQLIRNIEKESAAADAVIISDYGYGVACREIIEAVIKISAEKNIPVIADSRNSLVQFKGTTSATPNQEEVEQLAGKDFTDTDCEGLREKLGLKALLVTRGNKGMILYEDSAAPKIIEAVGSAVPVDVTGAGDTVIAVYAMGLASGLNYYEAAKIANHAGGIVVMKRGTALIEKGELAQSLAAGI